MRRTAPRHAHRPVLRCPVAPLESTGARALYAAYVAATTALCLSTASWVWPVTLPLAIVGVLVFQPVTGTMLRAQDRRRRSGVDVEDLARCACMHCFETWYRQGARNTPRGVVPDGFDELVTTACRRRGVRRDSSDWSVLKVPMPLLERPELPDARWERTGECYEISHGWSVMLTWPEITDQPVDTIPLDTIPPDGRYIPCSWALWLWLSVAGDTLAVPSWQARVLVPEMARWEVTSWDGLDEEVAQLAANLAPRMGADEAVRTAEVAVG